MLWTGRLCLLSVESVRRAPLPADEQEKWTFIHTRAASLLSKMHRNLPVNSGSPEEHPGERPSRPSCYATSAAKRHESQSTSRPQRAPARATLTSQSSAEADRKEEIWKSGEISCNQAIGRPRRTDLQVYIWGFNLHALDRELLLFFLTTDTAFYLNV